jgi:hypothetical protein
MSGTSKSAGRRVPAEKPKAKDAESGDDCDLTFEVDLSAVRAPFRQLADGAVLDVDLIQDGNLEAVVCRRMIERDVVGSLAAFEGLAKLIDCIRRGHHYVADVIRIARSSCTVRVRRAST